MEIVFYTLCAIFLFMGTGLVTNLNLGVPVYHPLSIGYAIYGIAGLTALYFESWWVLFAGFVLAALWRLILR